MNDKPEKIDRLIERLTTLEQQFDKLERRVDTLGHPSLSRWPEPARAIEKTMQHALTADALASAGGIFPLLGRAMLGIAGAYLLRAAEETGPFPRWIVAWAGIAYAFVWLLWAGRTRGGSRLASIVHACTSALILAPMLWELTLRFNLLPASASAAVLGAYALTSLVISLRREVTPIGRVGVLVAVGLSLALAIASQHLLPFITLLLVLAALIEFSPWRDRIPDLQVAVALAADAMIWVLIYIYFSPLTARENYPQLGKAVLLIPGVALFVIFMAGVIEQTIGRSQRISIFASLQTTIAFFLATVSLTDFGPPSSVSILGIVCLVLSVAGWLAVLIVFATQSNGRNFSIFGAWSALLLLSGCLLTFSPGWTVAWLGTTAIAATFLGRQRSWISLEFYGAVCLLVAAGESRLLILIGHVLGGIPVGQPALLTGFAAACAICCYILLKPEPGEHWKLQTLHLAVAALAAGAIAGLVMQAFLSLLISLKTIPAAHHLAFIRTLTLCTSALLLVFGGVRWRRSELTRLGYAALGMVAIKMLAEDLRHGHIAYIAASIFVFAVTLLAAPRVPPKRLKA